MDSVEGHTSPAGLRLLSINQAIFALGIGRTLAYELIELGKLKTVRIGRRRLVPIEAIDSFLANLAKEERREDQPDV